MGVAGWRGCVGAEAGSPGFAFHAQRWVSYVLVYSTKKQGHTVHKISKDRERITDRQDNENKRTQRTRN